MNVRMLVVVKDVGTTTEFRMKRMIRGVLTALVIGALFTGWASNKVEARPEEVPIQPQEGSITHSGASLRGLTSRSIAKDSPRGSGGIFLNPLSSNKPEHPSHKSGTQSIADFLGFTKRIEFGGLREQENSQSTSRHSPKDVENGDVDGDFKVRYRLNNQ